MTLKSKPVFQFDKEFKRDVANNTPRGGIQFIDYLEQRVNDEEWRGYAIAQHNRLHLVYENLIDLLHKAQLLINQHGVLYEPGGDAKDLAEKHSASVFNNYQSYIQSLALIGKNTNSSGASPGSLNSVKKNMFPDMERMGLIKREKDPSFPKTVRQIQLTQDAVDLLCQSVCSFANGYKLFSGYMQRLVPPALLNRLFHILWANRQTINEISLYEYVYIVSDHRNHIGDHAVLDLIMDYRKLKTKQKNYILITLWDWMDKCNGVSYTVSGSKSKKFERSMHNWVNQAQETFLLLNATLYFRSFEREYLTLSEHEGGLIDEFKRQSNVKVNYLASHRVMPKKGFEFHHVIPFGFVTNKDEYQAIDNWQNIIYISEVFHKQIPTRNNLLIELLRTPNGLALRDIYTKSNVKPIPQNEIVISSDSALLEKIVTYNQNNLLRI